MGVLLIFAEENNCRQQNDRESVRREYILSKPESIQIQNNARKKKLLSAVFFKNKIMKTRQTHEDGYSIKIHQRKESASRIFYR